MANSAFALSPISARATLPSEEDYEAIREAFMETARGRWFLDEYARRNRNADTRMVLDAVARIEETLAAQRKPPPPVIVDRLPAALISIRSAVEKAQEEGFAAFDRLRLEENLAPIRKGSRIIKEISWRWREIGADGRICDLIDSQVAAIDTACGHLAETDPRVALRAAFEIIRSEIEAFRDGVATEEAPPVAEEASPVAQAPRAEAVAVAPAPVVAKVAQAPIEDETEAASEIEAAVNEPEMESGPAIAEPPATEIRPADLTAEEADAQDEAVLEMVAIEMAAPDPDESEDFPLASPVAESEPMHVTTPPIVEPITSMPREPAPEPPRVLPQATVLRPSFAVAPSIAPAPVAETSLGSTLIASGILRKPGVPANDPLAPIRRMSQAEKIAFFS
jgi:hypothetical protein